MAIRVGQRQQNFHLCHPSQKRKDSIGPVWGGPCLLNDDRWFPDIFVISKIMLVGVVVPKHLWIIEPHRLPIDDLFYIIASSLQGAICCHQYHGAIWILHSINMKVFVINYYRNGTSIAYPFTIKVLLRCLSIRILWTLPHFLITISTKHPTLINSMIAWRTQNPESNTNTLPDPQIFFVSLNNNPQVGPSLYLYAVLPKSLGWYFPSTDYSSNKIPNNPQNIVWYYLPSVQGF